MHGGTIFVIQS